MQHPELAVLDGELDVLHVSVALFQLVANFHELREHGGHRRFQRRLAIAGRDARPLGDVLRRARPRHHVLALRVDEILSIQLMRAGRGVAGEGDAGRRRLAAVAEHHRLHVDGGAPVLGDVVQPAVGQRAGGVPGAENGVDGAPELGAGILRKRLAGFRLYGGLVGGDEGVPVFAFEIGVLGEALCGLVVVQQILEYAVVDAEHDVRIHLDEAAVAVVGEPLVAGRGGKPLDCRVIEAEIEDGVHHAGHRGGRARTHRHQQRVFRIAEGGADGEAKLGQRRHHLGVKIARQLALMGVEMAADLGADGEAGRHRQAEARHLGKVGAFAAEQLLHPRRAIGGAAAKAVHPTPWLNLELNRCLRCLRCWHDAGLRG